MTSDNRKPGEGAGTKGDNKSEAHASTDEILVKLEYIGQMALELRQIAEACGEGTLVYMLEMAAMEAEESRRIRNIGSRLTG